MKFKALATQRIQRNITDFNLLKFQYLLRLALRLHTENLYHYVSMAIPYHIRVFMFRKSYITYCLKTVLGFLRTYLYYY